MSNSYNQFYNTQEDAYNDKIIPQEIEAKLINITTEKNSAHENSISNFYDNSQITNNKDQYNVYKNYDKYDFPQQENR